MRCPTPHFIEAVVVFDCVGESHSGGRRGILLERCNRFKLCGHVTFMSQLELPLKIWLLDDDGAQDYHFGIQANPQYGRIAAKIRKMNFNSNGNWDFYSLHWRQIHVHLFAGAQRNFLLLISPTLRMACNVGFDDGILDLKCVLERAVQFL